MSFPDCQAAEARFHHHSGPRNFPLWPDFSNEQVLSLGVTLWALMAGIHAKYWLIISSAHLAVTQTANKRLISYQGFIGIYMQTYGPSP